MCGYSLSAHLEGKQGPSHFSWWHAILMYGTIGPVVCSLFCSYSMFVIFCFAHALDFNTSARLIMVNVEQVLKAEQAGVDVELHRAR